MHRFRHLVLLGSVVAALAATASAMDALDEPDMRQVQGQAGTTLAGDLNIDVGSFTYVDTDTTGGSIRFEHLRTEGLFVRQVDIVNGLPDDVRNQLPSIGTVGDVRQVAYPNANLPSSTTPSMSIEAITLGHGSSSLGGVQINNIDLQGTRYWLWVH